MLLFAIGHERWRVLLREIPPLNLCDSLKVRNGNVFAREMSRTRRQISRLNIRRVLVLLGQLLQVRSPAPDDQDVELT